jgi:hypothetical protein
LVYGPERDCIVRLRSTNVNQQAISDLVAILQAEEVCERVACETVVQPTGPA